MTASLDNVALVAIGRNEGERLRTCLTSVRDNVPLIAYVDSGSTDDSVKFAHSIGVRVVELDTTTPFTAARARNAGFRAIIEEDPNVDFIQFVDGDCEVVDGWCAQAASFLTANPTVAIVTGRRRERYPERSRYNKLCDLEWAVPAGTAKYCGGDVMVRTAAFSDVGGYRDALIAGEEPELCVRLRANGWGIHVLDAEMTLHDADMRRFGQWWARMVRSGYAYAQGAYLHGAPPERHWVWESARAWLWGLGPPTVALALAAPLGLLAIAVLAVYPLQILRLYLRSTGSRRERRLTSTFNVLSKFPEFVGQLKFLTDVLFGTRSGLIEYKR